MITAASSRLERCLNGCMTVWGRPFSTVSIRACCCGDLGACKRRDADWGYSLARLPARSFIGPSVAMPQKARPDPTYAGASRSSRPMGACGAAALYFAAS